MNYELAKELKEAGFPQKPWQEAVAEEPPYDDVFSSDSTYIPSLSELIEACGVRFEELMRIGHHDKPRWVATSFSCEECGWENMVQGSGSTPSEAVARLWLALNPSNTSL